MPDPKYPKIPAWRSARKLTLAQANILVCASEQANLPAEHVKAIPLANLIRKGYVTLQSEKNIPHLIILTLKGRGKLSHAQAVQKVYELFEATQVDHG